MKNCNKPLLDLVFNFNKGEQILYLKATTSTFLASDETLSLQNDPNLDTAATIIQYLVVAGGPSGNDYVKKIKLLENVGFTEENIMTDLRAAIKNDLLLKKTRIYAVTVSINNPGTTDEIEEHYTSTISENDTIEIEE